MDIDDIHSIAQNAVDSVRTLQFPELVEGRSLHADADVFSYKACDMEHSYGENVVELKNLIDTWRKLAGAEYIFLHLTMGTKGGREEAASVKEYQGNRSRVDQDKATRVSDLRKFMEEYSTTQVASVANYVQEADDSMAQSMWLAKQNGYDAVLFSPDKDLWMVGGYHLNKDTFEIEEFPWGYGGCYMTVNSEGRNKLKGRGTSWFWHQMLMGDSADNIPGLPEMKKDLWVKHAPTKDFVHTIKKLSTGRMPSGKLLTAKEKAAAQARYNKLFHDAKSKRVGPALAHKYLQNCLSDRMAYQMVYDAYMSTYGTEFTYTSWDGKMCTRTGYEMMLEQGKLLWMKREKTQSVEEWWMTIRPISL